jgi:hypothetical protein
MNHDCPPKNTKTACTLDHAAKRAFDAFAKGTPARKEWRKWIPFLHPVEILIQITESRQKNQARNGKPAAAIQCPRESLAGTS